MQVSAIAGHPASHLLRHAGERASPRHGPRRHHPCLLPGPPGGALQWQRGGEEGVGEAVAAARVLPQAARARATRGLDCANPGWFVLNPSAIRSSSFLVTHLSALQLSLLIELVLVRDSKVLRDGIEMQHGMT
jgi:hypothetical protein